MAKDKPQTYGKVTVTPQNGGVKLEPAKGGFNINPDADLMVVISGSSPSGSSVLADYVPKSKLDAALAEKGGIIRGQQEKIRGYEERDRTITAANQDLERQLGEASQELDDIQGKHDIEMNRLLTDAEMTSMDLKNAREDNTALQTEVDACITVAQTLYVKLNQAGVNDLPPLEEMVRASIAQARKRGSNGGNLTMPGYSATVEPITPVPTEVPQIPPPPTSTDFVIVGALEDVKAPPKVEVQNPKDRDGDPLKTVYHSFAYLVHEYFCNVFGTRQEGTEVQKKRTEQYYNGLLAAYAAGSEFFQPAAVGKPVRGTDLKILGTIMGCGKEAYADKGDKAQSAFFEGVFFPAIYSRLLSPEAGSLRGYEAAYEGVFAKLNEGGLDINGQLKDRMTSFFRNQRTKYEQANQGKQ